MIDRENNRQQLQAILDAGKCHEDRNRFGQFSTPYPLAVDIMKYVATLIPQDDISFLEPAIGTGVFYSAFLSVFKETTHTAQGYEIDPYYGLPSQSLWNNTKLKIDVADFLTQSVPRQKYSLLVSNPPYSRHHAIEREMKKRLQQLVYDHSGIKISGLAGLYCYFLILSTQWLHHSALSCWLIPGEFMDVNFGEAVKKYLLKNVNLIAIHRFSPCDMQFTDALVTSSIVLFKNEPPNGETPVLFSQGGSLKNPIQSKLIDREILWNQKKWSPLFTKEINDYCGATIGDYFTVKRGLATGNNRFFVLDEKTIDQYAIPSECLIPLLPGPRHLKENVVASDENGIPNVTVKHFLFNCDMLEKEIKERYPKMWEYIQQGQNRGIPEGYICSHRNPWYSCEKRTPAPFLVPYMGRSESKKRLFRFILNFSDAIATNVYLMLYPKRFVVEKLHDKNTIINVWETLNRISPEHLIREGRVYGGGLHKLEPHELLSTPAEEIAEIINFNPIRQTTLF